MEKPATERGQNIAREAYRQAYREVAELLEELRGKNVGSHGDHWAGLWAACRMSASQHGPWEPHEDAPTCNNYILDGESTRRCRRVLGHDGEHRGGMYVWTTGTPPESDQERL